MASGLRSFFRRWVDPVMIDAAGFARVPEGYQRETGGTIQWISYLTSRIDDGDYELHGDAKLALRVFRHYVERPNSEYPVAPGTADPSGIVTFVLWSSPTSVFWRIGDAVDGSGELFQTFLRDKVVPFFDRFTDARSLADAAAAGPRALLPGRPIHNLDVFLAIALLQAGDYPGVLGALSRALEREQKPNSLTDWLRDQAEAGLRGDPLPWQADQLEH